MASVSFTFYSKMNKAIISGVIASFLMGFFLIGYFIGYKVEESFVSPFWPLVSHTDIELLNALYLHLGLLIIIVLINISIILLRFLPFKEEIMKIKRSILEMSIQFSHLQIREVSELSKHDENTILKVGKKMFKNQEVYGEFISKRNKQNSMKKAYFLFDYKANNSNLEYLVSILK